MKKPTNTEADREAWEKTKDYYENNDWFYDESKVKPPPAPTQ